MPQQLPPQLRPRLPLQRPDPVAALHWVTDVMSPLCTVAGSGPLLLHGPLGEAFGQKGTP